MTDIGHNTKRIGGEVLADMLAGYGVTHVFMVPAVLRRTFAEMERRTKIARIHCHGEKSAAYMADGYARASGKPGICMAQVIGALNLAAGLRDAFLAHSPVIAMTGGRDPKTKFRKVYQEIDDVPAFEPVTKINATIDDVARFPDMIRQAFRVAMSGAPGPVHLQFRGNEGQLDPEEAEMEPLGRAAVRARAAVPAGARSAPRQSRARIAAEGRAAGHRRRRRRARLGRRARTGGARRSAADSGRDLAQRQGHHPRHPSAFGRRRRLLFARERQPRGQPRRPRLLHRHRDRRHDHAFLGGAARSARRRSRSTSMPEALGRNYPLQGRASTATPRSTLARMLGSMPTSQRGEAQGLDRGGRRRSASEWRDEIQVDARHPTRCRSGRSASATN